MIGKIFAFIAGILLGIFIGITVGDILLSKAVELITGLIG